VAFKAKDERRMVAFAWLFVYLVQRIPVTMARTNNNIVTKALKGQIGKQLVFKQYGKKTVVTRYPDMSKVVPSDLQKKQRSGFAKKIKKGKSVFQYAIQEFLKGKKQ
jgi:hypothetical protein